MKYFIAPVILEADHIMEIPGIGVLYDYLYMWNNYNV